MWPSSHAQQPGPSRTQSAGGSNFEILRSPSGVNLTVRDDAIGSAVDQTSERDPLVTAYIAGVFQLFQLGQSNGKHMQDSGNLLA